MGSVKVANPNLERSRPPGRKGYFFTIGRIGWFHLTFGGGKFYCPDRLFTLHFDPPDATTSSPGRSRVRQAIPLARNGRPAKTVSRESKPLGFGRCGCRHPAEVQGAIHIPG